MTGAKEEISQRNVRVTSPYKEEDGGGCTSTGLLLKRPLMCPEQNHKPSMNHFNL